MTVCTFYHYNIYPFILIEHVNNILLLVVLVCIGMCKYMYIPYPSVFGFSKFALVWGNVLIYMSTVTTHMSRNDYEYRIPKYACSYVLLNMT